MQNRERGAAHINIYFFLVLLVMFLGTLWFGYINMTEAKVARVDAADADIKRINAELKTMMLEHYVKEISTVIGERGDWSDAKDFNYTTRLESKWKGRFGPDVKIPTRITAPSKLTDVSDPEMVKTKLRNLAVSLKFDAVQATPIAPFLGLIKNLHDANLAKVTKAQSDVQVAQTKTSTLANTFRASDAQHASKLAKLQSDYTKSMNDLRNANGQQNIRIQAVQAEVKKTNDEKADMQLAHQVVVKGLNKEAQRNHGQMAALQARNAMRRPPQQSDGSVISASMVANRGWINIGRKDMLLRGTKFRIMNPSGTKVKGHGEVISTKQDRAELRLYGVGNRVAHPITKGDQIYNDLYSPNMKRKVAMIGRFSYPYTKPMIRKILEQLGNTVYDEVRVGVDMVIVGLQDPTEIGDALKPIEDTPGYKQAQVLHCEIVTISKIRDLLQLGDD